MIDTLRNHLLAATMHNRWETIAEIADALRRDYGLKITRADLTASLHELGKDPKYTLKRRSRSDGSKPEFRLYVQKHAIADPEKWRTEYPLLSRPGK